VDDEAGYGIFRWAFISLSSKSRKKEFRVSGPMLLIFDD
jgi:hypothetical protein